ncbi:probable histone-lysine N-methyltransferase CG1716 [Drosophila serrata]|uniref:probable histone-lysine N-methyltransferase CG1716 n=1 Tax=Drosophila serrata TaxID=7274 RepID=UPI000A1CFA17|nr:probable histone-lysine N-methyltransferase CG1716 [Drosophila serrata]XP_020805735.1 probable histone-lysine N-methyltransferase CG1716 [Drosophila serrata]XP_020805736.1 probable histone-lysine N-methyltransferase CG1716 [Drosophila serrata]
MEESPASAMGYSSRPAVASRGRGRGRPPKWATVLSTAHVIKANSSAAASPTPLSPLEADADGSPSECRRSSRKKIIKFDVRDLLSKNRKAHKIQIEARIDSNPNTNPSIIGSTASPGLAPSAANSNSNRLFSMFESSHQSLPPPPPPPHALEIFAKPRPTQSLIVAQVTSEPSANPVQTVAALPVVAVRKRGRPRKSVLPELSVVVSAAAPPTAPICSDSDTNSNSASTSTSTGSGSGGETATGAPAGLMKRKSKLRVSVKRLNLSRRLESSDSGETPLNITVVGSCTSPPSSSSSVGDALVLQDENALDEQPEKLQQQPLKELATIHVPGDNSDSDSQIIFIEIETSDTGKEDEQEQEQEQEHRQDLQEQDQNQELLPPAEVEEIEIDIDKQDSNPAPEQDLDDIMVEVLSEPPSLWSADDEDEEETEGRQAAPEEEAESNESLSQAPRRSRRSMPPRGGSSQGKTLEETFAEIAAESSKQILESEESQGQEEEQHVLIDLIEDDSQSEPEVQEVAEGKEDKPKEQELPQEETEVKPELEKVAASADQTETETEMVPDSNDKAIVEFEVETKAATTDPQPRDESKPLLDMDQPQTEIFKDSTKSLPEIIHSEQKLHTEVEPEVEPEPEAPPKLQVEVTKEEASPPAPKTPEESPQPMEESNPTQQITVESKQQTDSEVEPTDRISNEQSDTQAPTEQSRKGDETKQTSFSEQQVSLPVPVAAVPDEIKIASRESPSSSSPASDVSIKKSKKEGLTKKPTGSGLERKPSVAVFERREPKKSLPGKKEKLPEKSSPSRELAQITTKKGRTMETESEANSAKTTKPVKSIAGSKRETGEREKSSPENVGLHKKKEHRQSPPGKEKETSKSPNSSSQTETSLTDTAKPESPKNEIGTKKPASDSSPANKSKDKYFVECDAMFKAMDKANAQMRLEEKTKKKIKKVLPPKVNSPVPVLTSSASFSFSSSPASLPKKALLRKTYSCRRNTVYEDSPKLERRTSPGSDSTTAPIRVSTPMSKVKRTMSKSNLNSRRSTISEEAHVREKARVSPASLSSSDSSSKRNPTKRRDSTDLAKIKDKAASPKPSKVERRNTICEERQAGASPAIPLVKRRFSLHPKASADLLPDINKTAGKKRGRKPTKVRQDSLDSSSSASQGQTSTKSKVKSAEDHLLEIEESSESNSSGSKTQRSSGQASPELEAPDALKDIAKFIEDGVNLLKRDYKLADEESQPEKEGQTEEEEQQQVKQQEQTPLTEEDEFSQRVANMETPDTTLSPSPTQSNSEETSNNGGGGVRRSHRIKQKPQGPKASQGRGVTSMALAPISMDEQLAELANIEAINEQFLRSEGLNTFQALRENYYRCARQVSQENAEMQCDCFLTGDEEAQGHLCCGAGCINRMLMIECGPLCTNGDRCTNKRFQQHKCWPCRVFRTEKKGCGITAELQIPPGEFIMEYVGEVIDSEEFERRQHLYSKDRKRHYYFMALRGEAIIDATSKGNISRFINHSCDPNAETQKWTVNGELRIGFFSVKPIQPGEEITFDYQYQRYGKDAQRCYCEATNCRGWIGGEPDSDEGEQLDADSDSDAELEEELELEPEAADQDAGESRKITKAKIPSKVKVKQSSTTAVRKRKEQVKPKDREYKAGRWLKPSAAAGGGSGSGEKASRKPKVSKFHAMLEDPDVLEELSLLSRSGLKNQLDTLRFSRCMVRAKLLQTRLQLLVVLTRGELPCRRLFLDYHGLRLLHAWISENGNDNQLRETLLDALEALPIPNRTMLNDSRVYQSVQLWSSSLEQNQPPSGGAEMDQAQSALHKRMVALLQKWQALPEIFRIPKRERIEQMKEHEREADRQQKHALHASTALEDQREQRESTSDRYRQDRFRRDTTNSRISKPIRMSGNNTICTITTQPKGNGNGSTESSAGAGNGSTVRNDNRRRSDISGTPTESRRTLSKELRRSLFERKVALDEAEKRVCSEDWKEHELRCEFFGADLKTDTKQLPFYQNTETGEWFNSEDKLVPTPQRTEQQTQAMASPEESEDGTPFPQAVEYKLPAGVDPLPSSWNWRITPDGDIYYYHLRERISQWEPPTAEQRLQTLLEEDATQQPLHELQNDPELLANELIQVDTDYVGSLSTKSLAQYIEAKVKERRELRRNRLVSVRVISPRRDEDRLYNQLESRKYKENKEKIRRRKEIYRRRKPDDTTIVVPTPPTDQDASPGNSLPIQGYLYSSDEEAADITAAVAGGEPLPVGDLVAKATKVDELDALNMEPSTSQAALAALASGSSLLGSKRKLPMPPHVPEVKKQRSDNRTKKTKGTVPPVKLREAQEKFRFDVSGLVAELLRPYRKESCKVGRICSDEDYKFLIKRLSQHITAKEMRYCDESGHALSCTESVRHKSYDFIHQYMRKKGRVYRKPADPTPI